MKMVKTRIKVREMALSNSHGLEGFVPIYKSGMSRALREAGFRDGDEVAIVLVKDLPCNSTTCPVDTVAQEPFQWWIATDRCTNMIRVLARGPANALADAARQFKTSVSNIAISPLVTATSTSPSPPKPTPKKVNPFPRLAVGQIWKSQRMRGCEWVEDTVMPYPLHVDKIDNLYVYNAPFHPGNGWDLRRFSPSGHYGQRFVCVNEG